MKKIAMFVVVALLSFSTMAQEKKSEIKFGIIPGFGVGNSISHSAYSLFRGGADEVKTIECEVDLGVTLMDEAFIGLGFATSGYYTDNEFKERCSLNSFGLSMHHIHKVNDVWKTYFGMLLGPCYAYNYLTLDGEDFTKVMRWGLTVQFEVGPQFSLGSLGDIRFALFYGLSTVKAANETDFADTYAATNHTAMLTDNTGIMHYGLRGSFTF